MSRIDLLTYNYTAQARELAAALLTAADEAEARGLE